MGLEDIGRAFQERRESKDIFCPPLWLPPGCQHKLLWPIIIALVLQRFSCGWWRRWSSVSGHLRIQGGRIVTKNILSSPSPHGDLKTSGPISTWSPDNGKIYRMVAFSFFPSSTLFCGDLILWNSVLPPGWQEMMKIHGAFHKRRSREGLTCKGGQARIPEYSLSTFSKLSCLDAKSLQWRASQGCFLRSDKKYKRKTSWHMGPFSRLTSNIDFCLCCSLMLLDLTRRWENFGWGQGGGPCDNHSQLREWLLTGLPQRCILSRADTSEPETWRETSFWCMTPFPFGGGMWHCFSDLLDLVLSFSFPFSVHN